MELMRCGRTRWRIENETFNPQKIRDITPGKLWDGQETFECRFYSPDVTRFSR